MIEKEAEKLNIDITTIHFDIEVLSDALEFVKRDLPTDTKLWALINTPNEYNSNYSHQLEEFKSAMELNYLSEIRCTHASVGFFVYLFTRLL